MTDSTLNASRYESWCKKQAVEKDLLQPEDGLFRHRTTRCALPILRAIWRPTKGEPDAARLWHKETWRLLESPKRWFCRYFWAEEVLQWHWKEHGE